MRSWISPAKRRRIHEYLSFRAAVKTDAGTAAAAHTEESKVPVNRPELRNPEISWPAVFPECVGDLPLVAIVVAGQLATITCPTSRLYIENRQSAFLRPLMPAPQP
jgi:hypothetical protein